MKDQMNNGYALKKLLADKIGVEPEDINDEDSFVEDLHMNPTDLGDFVHSLPQEGFDIKAVDLGNLGTVEELIAALDIHDEKPL